MDYRARQRAPNTSTSLVNQHRQVSSASSVVRQHPHQHQQARQQSKGKQQQQQTPTAKAANSDVSSSSLASENEELNQLSSINSLSDRTQTAISNASSRQIMLAHHNNKVSHHQQQSRQQQEQQHHKMMQQQHQKAQMAANRQTAALQQAAQNLTVSTNKINHHLSSSSAAAAAATKQHQMISNGNSSGDNMTTSSSDQTLDDLQQLAHGYGHHRLHHHGASAAVAAARGNRYHHRHQFDDGLSGSSSGQSGSQSGGRFLLGVLFTLAEILLFTVVLLWLYWIYQHDDGLAWQNDRKQQFNTHAALMLIGFIFMNGQAILIYRSFSCCSKIYTKILHTILFVLATSAISLGLILGYTAQENVGQNNNPIMHFYSLHAWSGLATVGLFALQFVFGFISFLILLCCDQATSKFRAALLPIHKTFGLIIFSLAVATCLTGLLQTARSRLSSKLGKIDYHELAEAGVVINLIGACLICLAILMPYIIRNLDIKRPISHRSELDKRLMLSQLDMRI